VGGVDLRSCRCSGVESEKQYLFLWGYLGCRMGFCRFLFLVPWNLGFFCFPTVFFYVL
jgi:hypothetical protein